MCYFTVLEVTVEQQLIEKSILILFYFILFFLASSTLFELFQIPCFKYSKTYMKAILTSGLKLNLSYGMVSDFILL